MNCEVLSVQISFITRQRKFNFNAGNDGVIDLFGRFKSLSNVDLKFAYCSNIITWPGCRA